MDYAEIDQAVDTRARVRFAKGHLSGHSDWTGTLVGYNDLYDTVHVYVDAPGNPESGSKITYSRGDVELSEPAPFRETTIRIHGVERVIRTEMGGKVKTVKQLEAAHTKAVRAAIDGARQARLDDQYAEMVASAQKPQKDRDGWPGSGRATRTRLMAEAAEWRVKYGKASPVKFPAYTDHQKAKAPFPTPTATRVPEYLIETAPGEYATREAAESTGATERVDEVLPGLAVARNTSNGDRSTWVLRHLPSVAAGDEKAHLGAGFKTRARAREVALTDLAHLDWTRSQDELVADSVTSATVRFVKFREMFQTSKKFAWAEERMREAEAELTPLSLAAA
ncbi:hypothetical protein OG709_30150 [Streptomyces sp. NBC_01267]|uniref:hypothetical protein n=1 Tax=Streptomyces sp. NBC_01267 TaxID=2903805 RepID=UPI002E2F72FC|nr:hypothetical protein [Streptomyces sp. NBC_01267]